VLNAIAMPYVIRHNNDWVSDRHAAIADALGVDIRGMSEQAAGLKAAEAILILNRKVGLPTRLQDLAIPESDLEICAEMAMADGSIVYNPKPVTGPAEVLKVLRAAWQGIS
jgi:alcohol dehydrogenase class IV